MFFSKKKKEDAPETIETMLHCSFCGKSQMAVLQMIAGTDGNICDECVETCMGIIRAERKKIQIQEKTMVGSPYAILSGNKDAIDHLVQSVKGHAEKQTGAEKPPHLFMIGPHGVGKSRLVERLAADLDLPCARVDAAHLTTPVYNRLDPFSELLEVAHGDLEVAGRGIVFLDNVENLAQRTEDSADRHQAQRALAGMMDGFSAAPSYRGGQYFLDTAKILFVAAGSFAGGIDMATPKREAFKRLGFLPDFIDRFSVLIRLTEPDAEDLKHALTCTPGGLIEQTRERLGMSVSFSDDAVTRIAEEGLRRGTGLRGLGAVLDLLAPDGPVIDVATVERALQDGP